MKYFVMYLWEVQYKYHLFTMSNDAHFCTFSVVTEVIPRDQKWSSDSSDRLMNGVQVFSGIWFMSKFKLWLQKRFFFFIPFFTAGSVEMVFVSLMLSFFAFYLECCMCLLNHAEKLLELFVTWKRLNWWNKKTTHI